ncbi:unnamed protein product [Musa acuminata subsp. malaccensis]|uniref:(wild Malaysian banana) hypothetical protein n=1 Tax=Musa acuminata subsp. malaccensis TaxID=214687 RepID=A0A804K1P6_MUSAM|nr:PREDICTED: NAC domain-containing protein 90-like [Musa acuminata subsp. malaccensis]CAG1830264.1 unnamed protein product [Musa acuminata subsp. malaccensis]
MSSFPPGYRFYPTEEELIGFYLRNKLEHRGEDVMEQVVPVAHVHRFDPWQLPPISGEPCRRDEEQWFFFCPRQEREAHGGRPTRITASGYWKATGSPTLVYSSMNRVMGKKRTMVFYRGRAPNGTKTQWKMNEYRALEESAASTIHSSAAQKFRSEFTLCRIHTKSGSSRSFDRRPSEAVAAANTDAQKPVSAKRSLSHDSTSSDGNGSQRALRRRGEDDARLDNDNSELLQDWF